MGYNTRKISLSLSDLGVQLPGHNASRAAAHRSPSASTTTQENNTTTSNSNSSEKSTSTATIVPPPTKRVKRSHTTSSASSSAAPTSPPSRQRKSSVSNDRQRPNGHVAENTPPPSPGEKGPGKLDYEGINDDIVIGVLEQLESTGNRPHLIKELAAILIHSLRSVESSANPTAIISSRLTNYLRRPWTALAPCPLTKEQVTTHPRRVYYYLTTMPRQPIPEYTDTPPAGKRVFSPSISSGTDEEENGDKAEEQGRQRVSASPEIDLATHDVDLNQDHHMTDISFQPYPDSDQPQNTHTDHSHNTRSASPPLEHDEREFSQTANVLSRRKESEQAEQQQSASTSAAATPGIEIEFDSPLPMDDDEEESEEKAAMRNSEAAAALFGSNNPHHHLLQATIDDHFGSSPMLRPQWRDLPPLTLQTTSTSVSSSKTFVSYDAGSNAGESDTFGAWNELKSPENVELDELDDLLGGF